MSIDPSIRAAVDLGTDAGADARASRDPSLRPAVLADARILWQWRNESHARAVSRDPGEIPWETHVAWLDRRLADADAMILIGLQGGEPIGVIRFARRPDGEAEVSITIAALARGRGLGGRLLRCGCEHVERAGFAQILAAEIRTDNLRSRKLFEGSGFRLVSGDAEWTVYRRPHPADREVK